MTSYLRAMLFGCIAAVSVALLSPATFGAERGGQSYLFGLVTVPTSIHVTTAGLMSYSQLMRQLSAEGYRDVKLSADYPNIYDPHPELMHGFTSPDDEDAQITAVHVGWNGTAVKDGRIANVYVDRVLPPRMSRR